MPKLRGGTAPRISAAPRAGRITKSFSVRGPEGGSIGGIQATFSYRFLAEGNKARINAAGQDSSTPVAKSLFREPGIQNTFSRSPFAEFAGTASQRIGGERAQTQPSPKQASRRPEIMHVIPQRSQPRNGREFIQGLSEFRPQVPFFGEGPARAENVRGGTVFSTTVPQTERAGVRTTPDRTVVSNQRLVTRNLTDLAVQGRRSSERSLGINSAQDRSESVRIVPFIGNQPPLEVGRVAPNERRQAAPVEAKKEAVRKELRSQEVAPKPRSLANNPDTSVYVPITFTTDTLSGISSGLSSSIVPSNPSGEVAKATIHDASKAKGILQARQEKMGGTSGDATNKKEAQRGVKDIVSKAADKVTIQPVKVWKYINSQWQQVFGGYWKVKLPDRALLVFTRGKNKKVLSETIAPSIVRTQVGSIISDEDERKTTPKRLLQPVGKTKIMLDADPEQKTQTALLLVSQTADNALAQLRPQQTAIVSPLVQPVNQESTTVIQEALHSEPSAVIYPFPAQKEQKKDTQRRHEDEGQSGEPFNPPQLVFIVHDETRKNRMKQVAKGAALAKESPDGTVSGLAVAEASEKFTPDSKSPIIRVLNLLDGSEVAFWRHIMVTGPLLRKEWAKMADYYNKIFRPVATRKEKGFAEEATLDDLNLVFHGAKQSDGTMAA